MHFAILICGCLGAWLLVAGPVYQAALELREQEIDHQGIDAATKTVAAPPKVSAWWWLVPPVAYLKQRRRSTAYREAVMEALGPDQLKQTVDFMNKARGWLIVAGGAFLIAVKETWEIVEYLEWPVWVFVIALVVFLGLALGNVGAQMSQSARMLKRDEARTERKQAALKQG